MYEARHRDQNNCYFFASTLVQRRARQACIYRAINQVGTFVCQPILAGHQFERDFNNNVAP